MTTTKLRIRFASPDSIPSQYPNGGWTRTDTVMSGDYWTVRGPMWALRALVEAALQDNNLNDYAWSN